jgi:hypothetical protein
MTIQLSPEDEMLIKRRLKSGAHRRVEEVIHDALASQDAETDWLVRKKSAIDEKIARGLAKLDGGQGVAGETARARLQQRKADLMEAASRRSSRQ